MKKSNSSEDAIINEHFQKLKSSQPEVSLLNAKIKSLYNAKPADQKIESGFKIPGIIENSLLSITIIAFIYSCYSLFMALQIAPATNSEVLFDGIYIETITSAMWISSCFIAAAVMTGAGLATVWLLEKLYITMRFKLSTQTFSF